jgi:hypothetical protein
MLCFNAKNEKRTTHAFLLLADVLKKMMKRIVKPVRVEVHNKLFFTVLPVKVNLTWTFASMVLLIKETIYFMTFALK